MCRPRFQAGALLKPEHTQKRGTGVPSPSSGRLFGALNTKLSLQLNKTELSDERTLGYTVDELFVKG
jgi:hypothetical protein